MFLTLLSWAVAFTLICLLTLCLACGLYFLGELMEEQTVLAKKSFPIVTGLSCGTLVSLWLFEGFPAWLVIFGLLVNAVYRQVLLQFPNIVYTSPAFLLGCVGVVAHQYLSFKYMDEVWMPFGESLAYFTLCVWLAPFVIVISLSANIHVLPTDLGAGGDLGNGAGNGNGVGSSGGGGGGFMSFFKYVTGSRGGGSLPTHGKRFN